MNPLATLSVTDRFARIVKGLGDALAARISAHTITAALITLIWDRISRIDQRLQSLAAQLREGTLRPGHSGPRRFAGRRPVQSLFPRGFGWLLPLVPQHAAAASYQLRHLLADPEMAALVAATPRIARTLRPLCHMLGLPKDALPPQPPRPPKPQAVIAEVAAAPPPEPEPPPEPRQPALPPPAEPEANARAGPGAFSWWPWLLADQS